MKSEPIFPYLRPAPNRVTLEPWFHDDARIAEPRLLDESIPEWDENTPIRIVRQVAVDVAGVRADCRLGPTDTLALAVVWHCPRTTLRGSGSHKPIGEAKEASGAITLRLNIPADELAGEICVSTQLVLDGPGGATPLAPRIPGSILWSEEQCVALGGSGSPFPMEAYDFRGKLPSGALWYLDWDPSDPDLLWVERVVLLLNIGHPAFELLTASEIPPDRRELQAAVWSTLNADVTRQLITGLIRPEEFIDFIDGKRTFDTGSVGRRIIDSMQTYLRTGSEAGGLRDDLHVLREELLHEPQRFEAHLQDAYRFLYPKGGTHRGHA